MNVFWMDKDGCMPPDDASVSLIPFSKHFPRPNISSIHWVRKLPPPSLPIRVVKKTFFPNKESWCSNVVKTTKAIEKNVLKKAVLARCCEIECETPPDPFAISAKLLARAKNSTVFCFAAKDAAFLGATPEILFSRKKNAIQSEAVAGTFPRGKTIDEDAYLEQELLQNKKALKEISPVIEHLQKNLPCLSFSPLHVRKTSNVQHLCSKAEGLLHKPMTDGEILEKIHPTPALCGLPTNEAFQWIEQMEPFERGLYGGALGWSTPEQSVWVVAIRCCLIEHKTVKLYTGAGIVSGSNPEEEWEELNHKMGLYQDIFI